MAVFEYVAKNESGQELAGTYTDVASVGALRRELTKAGYSLVKARRARSPGRLGKRVKQRDVVAFAFKLAGMYSSGLSVVKCLETLEEQAEDRTFQGIIKDIRESVERGSSLKNAFEKYTDIFSDFFVGMVEAGEAAGTLSKALEMSASYLENRAELKQKVRSAFVYPIVVGVVCVLVVTCLLIFVVPMFSTLYRRLHVSLPGPTQGLVILSLLIRKWWWASFPGAIGSVFAVKRLLKRPEVRTKWDSFKLRMPIFAKLNRLVVVTQFTRTFAMLVSVGVPIIDALGVASRVAHNARMADIALELQRATRAGHPVAVSFGAHDIFPPMIVQLAAAGEQAGVLADMLNKGCDFLDKDIDRMINSLLVKLEPTLTVVMGAVIGLILMGVYLPMFDYMANLT